LRLSGSEINLNQVQALQVFALFLEVDALEVCIVFGSSSLEKLLDISHGFEGSGPLLALDFA
jgi:hypothetical protein